MSQAIPVILDTDIGTDIDDTWALAMLLRSPELDLKLVTTATGDVVHRAKIAAKFLEVAGRADIPVGIGLSTSMGENHRRQAPWVADYDLAHYPGKIHEDGVAAIIEIIMNSKTPVTLICIGPLDNIGAALEREPRIANNARFVGMHGSFYWSHYDSKNHTPIPEYNVKAAVSACRKVFAAPWDKTITPLDTCGRVRLSGKKYESVASAASPMTRAIIKNYDIWKTTDTWGVPKEGSSVLFDCVAVYLAFSRKLLKMKEIGVRVTEDGYTREDSTAPKMSCALEWENLETFEDLLVERLTR
jgi:inosine-uridine nucleoside N-ribohydrolase